MGVQDINTLLGIGGLQQQQGQRQLDVDRANTLCSTSTALSTDWFCNSTSLEGVPALQQTYSTTTAPSPSGLSRGLGLLTAGIGAAGANWRHRKLI